MNEEVSKLVFVVQDLKTKGGESVAVLSGDIHLRDVKVPVSFQMLLSDNKDFKRCVVDLIAQALELSNIKI